MEQMSLATLKAVSATLTWLAFGLAIVTALASYASTQVRSEIGRRSDARVAQAEVGAAKASEAAAIANERAEALKAENLSTQARLVEAERALEAERMARINLENRLAPRKISDSQQAQLQLSLGNHSTLNGVPLRVAVFATSETAEAQIFTEVLADTLRHCGFDINRHSVHYGKPYALHGVGVLTSDDPQAVIRGQAFCTALLEAGVKAMMLPPREAAKYPEGTEFDNGTFEYNQAISLMVGDRPA